MKPREDFTILKTAAQAARRPRFSMPKSGFSAVFPVLADSQT